MAIVPTWRQDDSAYVASISGQCGGVLDPLQHARPGTFNRDAALAFGLEIGGDIDAVDYPSARPSLATLTATVAPLRWSSAGIRRVVRNYLGAERSLLGLAPSNLCADAHVFVASHGRRISRASARWVVKFARRTAAAGRDATAFLNVLARYVTPSERGLISSTSRLMHRFAVAVNTKIGPEGRKLLAVLGL